MNQNKLLLFYTFFTSTILHFFLSSWLIRTARTTSTINATTSFDPKKDCENIRSITDPMQEYIDQDKLLQIICHRNFEQRKTMREEFEKIKKPGEQSLEHLLAVNGEISCCKLVHNLFKTDWDIFLSDMQESFGFVNTNERTIIEILLSIPQDRKEEFYKEYEKKHESCLISDIENSTKGDIRNVIKELYWRVRQPETPVNTASAQQEAHNLCDSISGWEDERQCIDRILMETPIEQLKAILIEFEKIHGKALELVIDENMEKKKKEIYKDIVWYVKDINVYYAHRLYYCMDEFGTDDQTLNRIITICSEKNLKEIAEVFKNLYGKSLDEMIKSDTTGCQQKLLTCMLEEM